MAGLTFLRVVSNAELAKQEQEASARELAARQSQPVILGLAAHLRRCWDAAVLAKQPIEARMLRALRQRNGEYEPAKLAQIKAMGGSEVYMMLTEVKCRAAESWLRDILLDSGTPPWGLDTTPLPDLDPSQTAQIKQIYADRVLKIVQEFGKAPTVEEMREIKEMVAQDYRFELMREAQRRVDGMQHKIEDQFAEGGWADAFNDFISDLVTYPAAFIKGPIVRRQRTLEWVTEGGRVKLDPGERLAPEYERVDPFDIFPEPGVTRIEDGYLFERHRNMPRHELADLIGVPGYDEDAIRAVLRDGAAEMWTSGSESQKEVEESKFNVEMRPTDGFDVLEFWGKVNGAMLIEWGMDEGDVPDPAREYDVNALLIGRYVVKAVLNYDPLGEKPYAKTSFIKTPGSFWGKGVPEVIEDVQSVCNAAARALVNNMGIASGPQVEVNVERLAPNEDVTTVVPWKIWQTVNDPVGASAPAIRFEQPDSRAHELMAVYDKFSRLADEHSGIPGYVYGDLDVQGAGRTSSGLSMLMGAAGKGIRQVVMHVDSDVIKKTVYRQFVYNMRYVDDESIKGDVRVVPKGAVNLAVKETVNVRRIEFLNATANPIDAEIIGTPGRAAILREVAKGLQMPADEIIPSREAVGYRQKIQARAAMQQQAAQQSTPTFPGGEPRGGEAGNVVSSRVSGAA